MKLLTERAKTHGDYNMTAQTAQVLKQLIRNSPSYDDMNAAMRESLDMTAVKFARIMCGDPFEADHWRDIIGYATLILQDLERHA
jgi:hypothetical protein